MEDKKKKAHGGFKETHIELHSDGSATVHHKHNDGSHKDVRHAAADLDGVHDSLQDHLGEMNDGEDQDMDGNKYAEHEALEEKLAPGLHKTMASMGKPEEGV